MNALCIGLEVHVTLKTKNKLFCSCPVTFGQTPNSQTCPVCLGQKNAPRPAVNRVAVKKALQACLLLDCLIDDASIFERKHYVSPDLPKGYQISQISHPLGRGGSLYVSRLDLTVPIRQVHLEEDAGRIIGCGSDRLIDFNRSGLPLIEVVTEPVLTSAAQAVAFLKALRGVLLFNQVTDGKMAEGSLRVDVNISTGTKDMGSGVYTEIKNLNSFKNVKRAIEEEAERQNQLKANGYKLEPQTRQWDETSRKTVLLRKKEGRTAYRIKPEPDLEPLVLTQEEIEAAGSELGEGPEQKERRFIAEFKLHPQTADQLTRDPQLARLFEQVVSYNQLPKETADWLTGEYSYFERELKAKAENRPDVLQLALLVGQVASGEITRLSARRLLEQMFLGQTALNSKENFTVIDDDAFLNQLTKEVLEANPAAVQDIKNGKKKALNHLIGQIMQRSEGRADVAKVQAIIRRKLLLTGE